VACVSVGRCACASVKKTAGSGQQQRQKRNSFRNKNKRAAIAENRAQHFRFVFGQPSVITSCFDQFS